MKPQLGRRDGPVRDDGSNLNDNWGFGDRIEIVREVILPLGGLQSTWDGFDGRLGFSETPEQSETVVSVSVASAFEFKDCASLKLVAF
jgi:hypothetical protein